MYCNSDGLFTTSHSSGVHWNTHIFATKKCYILIPAFPYFMQLCSKNETWYIYIYQNIKKANRVRGTEKIHIYGVILQFLIYNQDAIMHTPFHCSERLLGTMSSSSKLPMLDWDTMVTLLPHIAAFIAPIIAGVLSYAIYHRWSKARWAEIYKLGSKTTGNGS